jgi:phosphoribosylformimino-5-aminoimidazole carboxamide ribotide isomerase
VVDLDGAFARSPINREVVGAIAAAVSIPVQVGGGIRTIETLRDYMAAGVRRIILGTAALRDPGLLEVACAEFPGRIALGIDARGGKVAIEGWKEATDTDAVSLARKFERLPLGAIIYTDIHRDGMQSGVNIEATRRLIEATPVPVIASGGVASLEDILGLLPLVASGLAGVITGRALYDGTLDLKDALASVRRNAARQGDA